MKIKGKLPVTLTELLENEWQLSKKKKDAGIYQHGTLKNIYTRHQNIVSFMSIYGYVDMHAKDVNMAFCEKLKRHLSIDKHCCQSHTMRCIRHLKAVIRDAVMFEELEKNRIEGFNTNIPSVFKNNHLELYEIDTIEAYLFRKALQHTADLYVFCCHSGLGFSEMSRFEPDEHIITEIDGRLWICMDRKKTRVDGEATDFFYVPLFPKAKEILDKYEGKLPRKSMQKMNEQLKEIAILCRIAKKLTTHTARKTFGIIMMERNGFSLEAVSFMLGHKSVKTTEKHYARVRMQRVKKELLAQAIVA